MPTALELPALECDCMAPKEEGDIDGCAGAATTLLAGVVDARAETDGFGLTTKLMLMVLLRLAAETSSMFKQIKRATASSIVETWILDIRQCVASRWD